MNNEHVFEVDITVYILVVVGTVGVVVVDTGGVVVPGGVEMKIYNMVAPSPHPLHTNNTGSEEIEHVEALDRVSIT